MKKGSLIKFILITVITILALFFVIKSGGPSILRLYIETGIGDCKKIPILCMTPAEGIVKAEVNKEYLKELAPYTFPKMSILAPKGSSVVQEQIKKVYYKKSKTKQSEFMIYVDRQDPDFLINLFPKLRRQGIKNDFELMKHAMFARIDTTKTLNDAFFVILKSVFTPDLGDQIKVRMVEIAIAGKKGFVNYNVSGPDNYFDCNIFDAKGNFFKIYIKDMGATLNLDKALTIISTLS